MTTFNTNEEGIINSFRYHDLIFESLEVSEDKLFLIIQDNDKRHKTRIVLEGIKYLEVKELIPKGIVLSCYSFVFSKCPVHLKDELDFDRLNQYVENEDAKIFYADGTMGFEILVAYDHGFAEEEKLKN